MPMDVNPNCLLMTIRPVVRYGLWEAQFTNSRHAMTEVALIAYLMGMGYNFQLAHSIVESWEVDEVFPSESLI
jgi:hypothetical protein